MKALTYLAVARYRLEWRVTKALRLPDYAGSMLRGAFGHALRHLSCVTKQKACTGCPLRTTCPYPAIFEPIAPDTHTLQKFSQIPVPYIIEPPPWGARELPEGGVLVFHLVLIGSALHELPLIILAWRRALSRGLGPTDGTAELVRVVHCAAKEEIEIHRPEIGTIAEHDQTFVINASSTDVSTDQQITLIFNTPLRLQRNGRALLPERLDSRTLLMALIRRANLLAEFYCGQTLIEDFSSLLSICAEIHDQKNLTWLDWTRFSSRQQQKMVLGGAVGEWTLKGPIAPFITFLNLGQWLHVGKEASFGLGQYRLKQDRQTDSSSANDKTRDHPLQLTEFNIK